jgi:hypothetical protein
VYSFAWKLLRDRLTTKVNLAARGIITPAAQSCVSGCGEVEWNLLIIYLSHAASWLSMVVSAVMDWFLVGGSPKSAKPFLLVYSFIKWFTSTVLFLAAHLSSSLLINVLTSIVEQG